MDFHLSKEHEMIRKMYREFAENEVKPLAEEIDETERFPMETIEKAAKLGMLGIYFPKKYGGAGGDVLSYAMCVEEMSKVCGTTGVIISAHTSLCCAPIFENGTEEQKMKYLPDLLSGKKIGAFGLTEPNAGSDASKGQTEARLEGDHYVLNGAKVFITNGYVADVFVVFAMTDKSKGTKGITAFIVEKDFPGFSVGKHEKKMGIRGSSTCDLIFEDCIVPKENLLGKEGKGFSIAMQTLDGGRIGIAAQGLGIAEGALAEAINYVESIGVENIERHERELLKAMTERLSHIEGLRIYGTTENKCPIVSFTIDGTHPYDVGMILDKLGVVDTQIIEMEGSCGCIAKCIVDILRHIAIVILTQINAKVPKHLISGIEAHTKHIYSAANACQA